MPNGNRQQLNGSVSERALPKRNPRTKKFVPGLVGKVTAVRGPQNRPKDWIDPDLPVSLPQRPRRQKKWRKKTSSASSSTASASLPSLPNLSAKFGEDIGFRGSANVPIVPTYVGAEEYVNALLNTFTANPARIPEVGNHIPTEAYKAPLQSVALTVQNGTVDDGSICFFLRGDTMNTITLPGSISAAHAPDWNSTVSYSTYSPFTSSYFSRPISCAARIKVFPTGDPHVLTINSHRVQPTTLAVALANPATMLTSFTNVGPTALHKTAFDGSEVSAPATGFHAQFITTRTMNQLEATKWVQCGTDRSYSSQEGWCVWIYGLRSTDRVQLEWTAIAEYVSTLLGPVSAASVAVCSATSTSADAASVLSDRYVNSDTDRRVNQNKDSWLPPSWQAYWNTVVNGDSVQRAAEMINQAYQAYDYMTAFFHVDGNPEPLRLHPGYFSKNPAITAALALSTPPAGDDHFQDERKTGGLDSTFHSVSASDTESSNVANPRATGGPPPRSGRLSVPVANPK